MSVYGVFATSPASGAAAFTAAHASMYRDADVDNFGASAAFVDVTGWGGQNATATAATVSTANGTVAVTNAGTYRVTFTGAVEATSGNGSMIDVAVQVVKDGTLVPGARRIYNDTPSNGITGSSVAFAIDEIVDATAGQVFKPQVYAGVAGATTVIQIPYANFTVHRIA